MPKDIFKVWMRLQHEWLKNAENNRGSQLRWHRLRATAARAWSVAGFWWTNGWAQSALLQSWVLVMAGWTDWSLDKGIVACDSGGGVPWQSLSALFSIFPLAHNRKRFTFERDVLVLLYSRCVPRATTDSRRSSGQWTVFCSNYTWNQLGCCRRSSLMWWDMFCTSSLCLDS